MENQDLTPIFNAIESEEAAVQAVEVLTADNPWDSFITNMGDFSDYDNSNFVTPLENAITGAHSYDFKAKAMHGMHSVYNAFLRLPFNIQVLILFLVIAFLFSALNVLHCTYDLACMYVMQNMPKVVASIIIAYICVYLVTCQNTFKLKASVAENKKTSLNMEKESEIVKMLYDLNNEYEELCNQEVNDVTSKPNHFPKVNENKLLPRRQQKYDSKLYSDEEVRELLSNLRSPRPFVNAIFGDVNVTKPILLDSGAAVNLMAASLLDDIQRAKQKSYVLYKSSAVISGVGNSNPHVIGIVIIPTKLGNINIGPTPYLIVPTVTESTACLLGCKTLCALNVSMVFKQDNTISTSIDMHGYKMALPIELLVTETYPVFLCNDAMLLPKRGAEIFLSTEQCDDFTLETHNINLEIAPHKEFDNIDFCSVGKINSEGKISTYIINKSDDVILLPKYTDIGLCSTICERDTEDTYDTGLTDSQALSNRFLLGCPCEVTHKIFIADATGATFFEPKYSLLSPYSSKPPIPGLQFYNENIYIISSRKGNFTHITREVVRDFCKRHNITQDSTYYHIYSYAASINQEIGHILTLFMSICRVGIRMQPRTSPNNACDECASFSLLFQLEPKVTYPFRSLNVYILARHSYAIQDCTNCSL